MTEDIYKEIRDLDKVIHERTRLAIMTILYHHKEVNFKYLKEALQTTDGNLATHLKTLENAEYITTIKRFNRRKPETIYKMSEKGRATYKNYIDSLEVIFKKIKE